MIELTFGTGARERGDVGELLEHKLSSNKAGLTQGRTADGRE